MKMINPKDLPTVEKCTHVQNFVWHVQEQYPHIITKRTGTNVAGCHVDIMDAFKQRRKMCSLYMKAHELREEFNNAADRELSYNFKKENNPRV